MNYYYTTGVTKDGFPIYKCIRGTSALEGYHRHLRALVAQGCISPRLLIALLRCFNYRWNVERSVDNEDLPPFYSGWYSHWNVESSQDATANWFDEPVHSDWISTKEFVSSGEKFYLISNGHDGDANDGAESDEDDLENTLEHQTWTAMLPPSLQWLARQEGVKIPTTRFATPQERDLFKDNYRRFRSSSKSQDSHDQWDFAAMAVWWDAYVDELEKKRGFSSGIFRKTEAILRSFYKERLRIINIASTVAQSSESGAPLREVNFELQQALRDDGGFAFLEGAPRPKRARGSSCLNCVQHCPRIPHVSSSLRGSVLRAAAMDTAELTFDDGTMANGHPSRSLQVNFKVPPPGPGSVPDESANNRMFPTRDGISQRIFVPPMQAPGTMFSPPPPPPPPPSSLPLKPRAAVLKRPSNQSKGNTLQNRLCRRCGHQKNGYIVGVEARHFHKHGGRWCSTADADFCTVEESLRLPGFPLPGYAPARTLTNIVMPWEIASGLPAMGPWALSAAARMAVSSPPCSTAPSVHQGRNEISNGMKPFFHLEAEGADDDGASGADDEAGSDLDQDSDIGMKKNDRDEGGVGNGGDGGKARGEDGDGDGDVEMASGDAALDSRVLSLSPGPSANNDDGGDDEKADDFDGTARRELLPPRGAGPPAAQAPSDITPPPPLPAYLSNIALAERVRQVQVKFKLKDAADYSADELRSWITISLVHPVSGTLRLASSAHKVTAPYLAALLRLRGYAVHDGDLERVLSWLESASTLKTLPAPSDELRRYLARAVHVDDTPGQVAPSAPFDNDDDGDGSGSEDSSEFEVVMNRFHTGRGRGRGRNRGRGRGRGRGRDGGGGVGRARSRSRDVKRP